LFQPTTLTATTTPNYTIGAPIQLSSGTLFTLPGDLAGSLCQPNVYVLFGVDSDVSCPSITPSV